MMYLKASGFATLSVSEYISRQEKRSVPARTVLVTFDDGIADFYDHALPILLRHSCNATLYVTTGYVGATSKWLSPLNEGSRLMVTWSQLREIHAEGVECGAHTASHVELDVLDEAAARSEIEQSRDALAAQLGRTPATFAYPYGFYNRKVRKLVAAAGFTSACAVNRALSHSRADIFALPRIAIGPDVTEDEFVDIVEGRRLPLVGKLPRVRSHFSRLNRRRSAGSRSARTRSLPTKPSKR